MKKNYLIGFVMCMGIFFVFAGLHAGEHKEMPPAEAC